MFPYQTLVPMSGGRAVLSYSPHPLIALVCQHTGTTLLPSSEIDRYLKRSQHVVLKRLPIFRIGLIMIAIGAIWTGAVFASSIKQSETFSLDRMTGQSMSVMLKGKGIGFYEISSGSFDNSVLVKVLDPQGNFLAIKTITNKETVNYFTFNHSGEYALELTNLSKKPVSLTVEFGDTKYEGFIISLSVVFLGAFLLVLAGYLRLRRYITAQPE